MANFIQNVQTGPYAGEQMEIDRKRKLAQMLQAQSMEAIPNPSSGAMASPISPLHVLAKGLQGYKGRQAETEAKTQAEELGKRQQSERQAALAAALRQGMGAEAPAPELGGGPAMPANPVAGMSTLAQSGDPQTISMGMGPLQAMQAQQQAQQAQQFRASESAENRAAREAQANAQRQFQEQQAAAQRKQQEDMARLTASLKQPPQAAQPRQQQIIQTEQGPMILGEDGVLKPIIGPGGVQARPPARQGGPMTATAQKELIETEEQIQGGQAAIELFKQARLLNKEAMGFTGAGALASAGSMIPEALRPATVEATQNLDNILQTAALPQLKAIFGGMPTEGERKILLDVQGSSSKPANVRKDIFDRAERAIQNRIKFAGEKAKRLREGTYFTGEGLPSLEQPKPPEFREGQTATGPNGQKMIFRGGAWQTM